MVKTTMGTEIRFHGRGGQGVVTAAKLLAEASMTEDKYFQALPDYGGERMGAPIRAYTRISEQPIVPHCLVTEPDIVIVIDPTLIDSINVIEGIAEGGALLINSPQSPAKIRSKLNYTKGKVGTVDATKIALATLGRNFPNIPMLGALPKVSQVVNKANLAKVIEHKLGAILSSDLVKANLKAFEQGYEQCKIG